MESNRTGKSGTDCICDGWCYICLLGVQCLFWECILSVLCTVTTRTVSYCGAIISGSVCFVSLYAADVSVNALSLSKLSCLFFLPGSPFGRIMYQSFSVYLVKWLSNGVNHFDFARICVDIRQPLYQTHTHTHIRNYPWACIC